MKTTEFFTVCDLHAGDVVAHITHPYRNAWIDTRYSKNVQIRPGDVVVVMSEWVPRERIALSCYGCIEMLVHGQILYYFTNDSTQIWKKIV